MFKPSFKHFWYSCAAAMPNMTDFVGGDHLLYSFFVVYNVN